MGLLDSLLGFSGLAASAPSPFPHDPTDERAWSSSGGREWWGGFAGQALTGGFVRPDDAIGVSAVFLGVRIWCNVLGTAPVKFYRQVASTGEETPLPSYRLARLLSTDGLANPWQTGALWRMWTVAQQILWGLGLSEIKFGANGLELWPIEGDAITRIEQVASGKIRYHLSELGQAPRVLTQDQVLRVEGASTHRLIPESILRRAREAVGAWLAQEQYRSAYFRNGAAPSAVFTHPGTLSDKALERLKSQLQARTGGAGNAHRAMIVEEGTTVDTFGTTAKDALLVDAWNATVIDVARFLEMPAFLLSATATLPYNSREAAMREWKDTSVGPRARLIEGAWKRDLLDDNVVAEHDLTALTLGDALAQQQAHTGYVTAGVLSVNEVRTDLGRPKLEGDEYDLPRRSANLGTDPGGDPRQTPRPGDPIAPTPPKGPPPAEDAPPTPAKKPKPKKGGGPPAPPAAPPKKAEQESEGAADGDPKGLPRAEANRRLRGAASAAAGSLLRRECEQLRRRALQLAGEPEKWRAWVAEFYTEHRAKMASGLYGADPAALDAYVRGHRDEVAREGVSVCERWERGEAVQAMIAAAVATGEEDAA